MCTGYLDRGVSGLLVHAVLSNTGIVAWLDSENKDCYCRCLGRDSDFQNVCVEQVTAEGMSG